MKKIAMTSLSLFMPPGSPAWSLADPKAVYKDAIESIDAIVGELLGKITVEDFRRVTLDCDKSREPERLSFSGSIVLPAED